MQAKARFNEKRAYLALRPSNYAAGRLFRLFGKSFYVPGLGYMVNDAETTKQILRDGEHFSIKEAGGLGMLIAELMGSMPTILSMDGKEHQRVKYALLGSFQEEVLQKSVGREVAKFADNLCAELKSGKDVDIAEFISHYTNRITTKLLGVTVTDEAELLTISRLVNEVMGCIDLKYKLYSPANRLKGEKCVKELVKLAKKYYNDPKVDKTALIPLLKKLGYSEEKTYGFIVMFLVAGTITISTTFPRLLAILIDSGSIKELVADPTLMEAVIQEGLRFITPGPVLLHGVKKQTTINGVTYKENRRVVVLLYNILHSSRYTPKAHIFDIHRKQNPDIKGLWFGIGPHFCMGSVLAQLEMRTLLKSLIKLDGEFVVKERVFRKEGIYPGYEKLVVALKI